MKNSNNNAAFYSFFTDPALSGLSLGAKVLYRFMLDRAAANRQNGAKEAYIIYTVEQVKQDLTCTVQKAVHYLKELENSHLISRIRRGHGQPALTYVTAYQTAEEEQQTDASDEDEKVTTCSENQRFSKTENHVRTEKKVKTSMPKRQDVRLSKTDIHLESSCAFPKDFPKRKPHIYNNLYQESVNTSNKDIKKENLYTESIHPSITESLIKTSMMDDASRWITEEQVKEQIEYEVLKDRHDSRQVDEIVMIMTDALNATGTIRIKGRDLPADIVRNRLMKLTFSHIEYVLDCLSKVTKRIRNIYGYILTSLYFAPATFNNYVSAMVSADMYQYQAS